MSNIYLLSNTKQNYENVINLNIFDINFINNNINFNSYDALIFTSKNAIYSLEHFKKDYKNIPSYAIAKKTATILKQYNSNLKYIGDFSNGDDFANAIKDELKNKKVLYIRAKKVVSNIVNILKKNSVFCDEIIVYETLCKKYDISFKPEKNSIIIFTSPSSIKCFLNSFLWDNSYKAVVIGKTTALSLSKNIKYYISKSTSINDCVLLARTI